MANSASSGGKMKRMSNSLHPEPSVMIVCDYSLSYLGGAQIALVRQARALADAGWRVTVVAPDATQTFRADRPTNLATRDPKVLFTLPGLDLPMLPTRGRLSRALVKLGKQQNIDGIIVHSEFALAAAALEAARELDVPLLHTVHTYFWDAPKALAPVAPVVTAFHRTLTGLPGKQKFRGSTTINNALRSMTHRLAVEADAVISPSRHQADALRIAGVENVHALSNVVQPLVSETTPEAGVDGLDGEPHAPDTAHLRLVWAGRFAPEKRIEVVLEGIRLARAGLASAGAGENAIHIDIAGGHGEFEPGVTYHGRLESDEVGELISRANAVVLTSLGFDNQPMIALEACARKRPVIVSDPVLAREFGEAAINAAGDGTESGDAAALANVLIGLAIDRGALDAAGQAAEAYARDRQGSAHAAGIAAILQAGCRAA
ncbi:glycosyltransferase family 4 protein [Leucobacter sp. 1207-22]